MYTLVEWPTPLSCDAYTLQKGIASQKLISQKKKNPSDTTTYTHETKNPP
jgi:hypothetical protein